MNDEVASRLHHLIRAWGRAQCDHNVSVKQVNERSIRMLETANREMMESLKRRMSDPTRPPFRLQKPWQD